MQSPTIQLPVKVGSHRMVWQPVHSIKQLGNWQGLTVALVNRRFFLLKKKQKFEWHTIVLVGQSSQLKISHSFTVPFTQPTNTIGDHYPSSN